MFDKYRYEKTFQLIVDTTEVSSNDYNLKDNCLSKKKDNKIKYFKYVLEAKLCVGNLVLSLDTEWIENTTLNNENEVQKDNYYLSSDIEFKENLINTLRYIDKDNKKAFNYITD